VELINLSDSSVSCTKPPDLAQSRYRGGAAIFLNRIEVCGGYNDQTMETLSDCLEYDPETNEWVEVNSGSNLTVVGFSNKSKDYILDTNLPQRNWVSKMLHFCILLFIIYVILPQGLDIILESGHYFTKLIFISDF